MTNENPAGSGGQEASGRRTGNGIDTTVPHSARIWNYWLGGKDNYAVDREAGDQYKETFPGIEDIARAQRAFLTRSIGYLTGEAGIRQFLDVGTGLPTANNTHQVAQKVAPEARIVYVDNDPLVLAHARALLTSTSEGITAYIDADLGDTDAIMMQAAQTLDFRQPTVLILHGILGHVPDTDEARNIVRRMMARLAAGSYLDLADGTGAAIEEFAQAQEDYNDSGADPYVLRTPAQLASFFDGLELVPPGVVSCPRWRPDRTQDGPPPELPVFGGVARKP